MVILMAQMRIFYSHLRKRGYRRSERPIDFKPDLICSTTFVSPTPVTLGLSTICPASLDTLSFVPLFIKRRNLSLRASIKNRDNNPSTFVCRFDCCASDEVRLCVTKRFHSSTVTSGSLIRTSTGRPSVTTISSPKKV